VAGRLHVGAALGKTNLANTVDGIILNGTTGISLVHDFTLTFDAQTTPLLASNATPIQVASALNGLTTIQNAGGVSVGEAGGNFIVTFNKTGIQDTITGSEPSPYFTTRQVVGNATTAEVENVQVIPTSPFTLTFGGLTTGVINYQGDLTKDPGNVQTALDGILGAGAVKVTETLGTATSYPVFQVTFKNVGAQTSTIVPNFQIAVNNSGSAQTQAMETITLPDNTSIDPTQIPTANFVGSIVNPVRPNATTFSYNPLVAGTGFQFGDAPIDGLIAALNLTSYKSFIPQVYLTADASGNAFVVNNLNG